MVFARATFIFAVIAGALAGKDQTCEELYSPLGDFRLSTEQLAAGFAQQLEEQAGVPGFAGSGDFDALVRQMFVEPLAEVKRLAIGSQDELITQLNNLATTFLADEQNYDKLDDLVDQAAQIVVRFRIGGCPLLTGYTNAFPKFFGIINSKKNKTNRDAKELIPRLQESITKLSKGPHMILCSCRGANAALYLSNAIASSAAAICGGQVALAPENAADAVDRLKAMVRVYLGLFPQGASTTVSKIWEHCNVEHLGGAAPAHVTKFGLKLVQEIFRDILKNGGSKQQVADVLHQLAYASHVKVNDDVTDDVGLAQAKLAAGLQLDFSGDRAAQSRLLLHEVLVAGSVNDSVDLPEDQVDNVVENFQTAFALDEQELAALGALNVARGSVAELEAAGGSASEQDYNRAKVAFVDTVNEFIAQAKPAGDRAAVIEAFDAFLDDKTDSEYCNLFKLINLTGYPPEKAAGFSFGWTRASPQSKKTMQLLYPKVLSISSFVDGLKSTSVPLSKISANLGFTESEEEAELQAQDAQPKLKTQGLSDSPFDQSIADQFKEIAPVADVDESKSADKKQQEKQPAQKREHLQPNPNFQRRDGSLGADSHYVYENRLKGCNAVSLPKKVAGPQQPGEEVDLYFDEQNKRLTEEAFNTKVAECLDKAAGRDRGAVRQPVAEEERPAVVEQEDQSATYVVYTHMIDMNCSQLTLPTTKTGRPDKDEKLHIYVIISEQNPREEVSRAAFQDAQRKCDGQSAVVAEPDTGHNYTIIRLPNGCRYRSKEVERGQGEEKDQYFFQASEIGAAQPVDKAFYDDRDRECTSVQVEAKEQQYSVTVFTVDKDCNPGAIPKTVHGEKPKESVLYQRITDAGAEDLTAEQYKAIMAECQSSKMLYTEVHTLLPNGDVETKSGYYPHKRPEGYGEVNYFRLNEKGEQEPLTPEQFQQLREPKDVKGAVYITDKLIKVSEQGCVTIDRRVLQADGVDTGKVRFIKTSRELSSYAGGKTVSRSTADKLEDGEELIDEPEYNRLQDSCKAKRPTLELDLAKASVESTVTISDDCTMKIDIKTTYGSAKQDKINYQAQSGLGDIAPLQDAEFKKLEDQCFSQPSETQVGGKPGWATRKYVLQNCGLQIHTLTTTEKPADDANLNEFVLMSGSRSSSISKELFRKNWDDCKHGDFEPDFGEQPRSIDLGQPANDYKSIWSKKQQEEEEEEEEQNSETREPATYPVMEAAAMYMTEARGITSKCKFEHDQEFHDANVEPGQYSLTFFYRDEETNVKSSLTKDQYNEKYAKCLKQIQEEGEKADAQKRIARILSGSLNQQKLEELQAAPDLMAYIREKGVVEEESEDHIDQYVFVEVSRESSPCHQTFSQ